MSYAGLFYGRIAIPVSSEDDKGRQDGNTSIGAQRTTLLNPLTISSVWVLMNDYATYIPPTVSCPRQSAIQVAHPV